jgi:geranylgeranyl reductase family protein
MIRCDALVVGGGPAGSTCARALGRAGWNVVVADRARFPRDKVCAGWLTPAVFGLLELDPAEYRATGATLQDISGFRTGVIGDTLVETAYERVVSYAIRRREFDAFLLHRAGARILENTPITTLRRSGGAWVVNDAIETPVVIGAGGHFCPVSKYLRGGADTSSPVVAKEIEFKLDPEHAHRIPATPELFFCRDMEGYAWSVRKGDYLNVGIGRRDSKAFARHIEEFVAFLERRQTLEPGSRPRWRGHAYMARGAGARPILADGLLVVGDAAGLAFPESGEGIKPAIESGRLAANTLIASRGRADFSALQPYAEEIRRRHPGTKPSPAPVRAVLATLGRALLRSPTFTRHVVLNRWFLRTASGS